MATLLLATTAAQVAVAAGQPAAPMREPPALLGVAAREPAPPARTRTPEPTAVGALGGRPRLPAERVETTPTPRPPAPAVVRFRPRDGWTDVSPWAPLSVRFTAPMDRAAAEAAFAATIGVSTVTGSLRWAEGDTVLVLQPAAALPFGAEIRLSVAPGALSAAGVALVEPASVAFTVAPRPAPPAVRPTATAGPAPTPTSRPTPTSPPAGAPPPAATGWQWPLIGPITQRFGESLTQYGFHQGLDIDGDTGDPVRAARGGTVTVAGRWDDCGGLQVHVDHGDGSESWYRHLSRIDVVVGQKVAAGALLGAVGSTGCSTGSHLHFAIRDHGTFVDPERYLPER